MDMKGNICKKDIAKAYENYIKQFMPRPKLLKNSIKAFFIGGAVCAISMYLEKLLIGKGLNENDAGTYVVIILIIVAQLLTGIGLFDTLGKHAGAGIIVPITGFANSIVAPAIEYKKEGIVLGVGSKLFSVAGPVLVCGISSSMVVGVIYWLIEVLNI